MKKRKKDPKKISLNTISKIFLTSIQIKKWKIKLKIMKNQARVVRNPLCPPNKSISVMINFKEKKKLSHNPS